MKKVVIVIPTYNEAGNINRLLEQIFDQQKKLDNFHIEVLIVDSSSPDGTAEAVKKLQKKYKNNLHLLTTAKEGLGRAYTKGFSYAIEHLSPYLLMEMDADLQFNPHEIPNFMNKIESGADFVIGSRYIKGGSIPKNWGFHRKFLSVVGNIVIRLGFMKLRVSDWTSGFRAIKVWVIQSASSHIKSYTGYVFQIALLDHALKIGAKVAEVPVKFTDRTYGESKINSIQYTVNTLLYTFSHSSFVRYVLVGFTGFAIDFGLSYIFFEKFHMALWLGTILSAELALLSNFTWNNFWSFSHKRLHHSVGSYLPSFFKFNLIGSGSLLIQAVGIELLAALFGRRFWYIYKIFIIGFIIIPYSYLLYNRVIWKEHAPSR